ncbi:tyrosinase family protein [Catenuloplanes japonicus]|uniref:tyrosinase family protein n=1 Tax=Catenuloplanes japonicus TaxID=33876 RepID=UPI000690C18A|nr:tyrosinase family protein [Catenuloplanes japonicus]
MQLVLQNFGFNAGGWREERHPRFVTDLTGDGVADILGFGEAGALVAANKGGGTFNDPFLGVANFGFTAGGWRVDRHPRIPADVTGDGRPDLVGFGDGGVWVSFNDGNGRFTGPRLAIRDFGWTAGGWRVERHPRFVADLTGDGRGDIVGFGNAGVMISINNGDGTFRAPQLVRDDFGYDAGGWRVERHPRFVADLTGDGRADIVGFGDGGVWVARNDGSGGFGTPQLVLADFGYSAGGWRVERHPRFLADTTGDGRPDIVGFGDGGVWVARNDGTGGFGSPQLVVSDFGYSAGGWRVERHPRFVADLTGDGRADIVGFGDGGVWVSRNDGSGGFGTPRRVIANFGYTAGGWRVEKHPRVLADITGDGRPDIVGFGDGGVWTAHNNGDGTFQTVRIRRDIWELQAGGAWDPITLAYAKAVRALRARALTDPRGWEYQAAVHGRAGTAPAGTVWNECQHGSWHFLPWHRAYLYYFEEIVRAEVIAQGGPADWALPYWNYAVPGRNSLPPAFRQRTMPDGTPNPLFVAERNPAINNGATLPSSITNATQAMSRTTFAPPPEPSFGGGRTTPQHFWFLSGDLELTPHNDVHVLIGGWMGDPDLAALDPIFWLHHANIDRLWSSWLALGGGRSDPGDADWRGTSWRLHDASGNPVTITNAQVLDTAGQLGYVYQDGVAPGARVRLETVMSTGETPDEPEFVGASDRPLTLTGDAARVEVPLDAPTVTARGRDAAQVLLNLEDIEADRAPATVYEVYVRPIGTPSATPHHVGNVSFFGIEHLGAGEAPHGFRRTFDITEWVAGLRDRGEWSDEGAAVSFRPVQVEVPPDARELAGAEAAVEAQSLPVRIGRVSIFYR